MTANSSPVFSVILSNCNSSEFLSEAIQSVLSQTLSDFELIIVDNGSNVYSRNIISGFDDNRIVTAFGNNGGQASALNAGFAAAKGLYISFLDSDDRFDANKLRRVMDVFKQSDYALVQHRLRVINHEGKEAGALFPALNTGEVDVFPSYFRSLTTNHFSVTSGITAPRRLLRRIFPLPEAEWKTRADIPLTRPLPAFGKIFTLEEAAGCYRSRENNNRINIEERQASGFVLNVKINRYINAFLRRWGIPKQIEIPLPTNWMVGRKVRFLAIYGAGNHTRYLLECQGLPTDIDVTAILDDSPSLNSIAGVPVCKSSQFNSQTCDAVLISSQAFETEMTHKALRLGWTNVLPIYSVEFFRKNRTIRTQRLVEWLYRKRKRRIALYGAGMHSLNLILSELLPANIEVACLLDEKPPSKACWGIPIFRPAEVDRTLFDAVVISGDVSETEMFGQARTYGFESTFLFYGAEASLRQNRADFEDVRYRTACDTVKDVAIYDPCWFTQCLLQCDYINDVNVSCILAEKDEVLNSMCDVPVLIWREVAVPSFDLLVVPPRVQGTTVRELKDKFGEKVLALPVNPDEIDLVHAFLRKRGTVRVMLDVGANTGQSLRQFAEAGWRIHAFEPDSVHRRALQNNFATNPRVSIYSVALSNAVNEKIPLYRSPVSGGISGLSVFHESHYLAEYIRSTRLELFVREQGLNEADFLKIDTEGYDLFVLQGNDWTTFRPRVIMCEYENHKTIPLGYDFDGISSYLKQQDYSLLISEWEPVIEYGNQPRWKRFADYPCKLLDTQGFGNIFAFRDQEDYDAFKAMI